MFPIGHIIHSYTCSTEVLVKASYRGNSWSQITSRFLYGSTSASTTGGSNNAVVVSHTHRVSYGNSDASRLFFNYQGAGSGSYCVFRRDLPTNISTNGSGALTADKTGEDGTNKNMPAYYTCYIWRRVS